jgi:hypothetical protein
MIVIPLLASQVCQLISQGQTLLFQFHELGVIESASAFQAIDLLVESCMCFF